MKSTYQFVVNGEPAYSNYAFNKKEAVDKMHSVLFYKINPEYRIHLLANNYSIRIFDNMITVYM